MIRLLNILSIIVLAAACSVAYACARQWSRPGVSDPAVLSAASALQTVSERSSLGGATRERASPLVAQAEALARYLKPPPAPAPKPPMPKKAPVQRAPAPAIRPVQATPKFTVRATSYCETRPEKSMALIAEPGAEAAYWVREGQRIGHFAIHEIKPGAVIYLAGEELRELAVARDAADTVVAGTNHLGPGSSPSATAVTKPPAGDSAGPSRRPNRRHRRTVGSDRNRELD